MANVITLNRDGLKQTIVQVPEAWQTPGGGPSRDAGKRFLLTEWPAFRAERWAWRFVLSITRTRAEIPVSVAGLGWEAIAIIGWNTLLKGETRTEEFLPLVDELLQCVQVVRDPKARAPTGEIVATPLEAERDLREIQTVGWLRDEVVRLHSGFSIADAVSSWLSTISSAPASPQGQETGSGTA